MSGILTGWIDSFASIGTSIGISNNFHSKQKAIHEDHSGMVSIIGGRRSGKTEVMVGMALELADQFPGETVAYLGPTLRGISDLVFPKVREIEKRLNVKLPISVGSMHVSTPNGGKVQLYGMATFPDVEKGRGFRFPGVFIDEAGAMRQQLLKLAVTESFGPATADFSGRGGRGVTMGGTPPYIVGSYFEEMCGGNKHESPSKGPTVHHMTLWDNPYFEGRADDVTEKWLRDNGLTKASSQYRREWLGEFCVDTMGLCYGGWNGTVLPRHEIPLEGYTILGLDLGVTHPNAWVVVRITPEYFLSDDKNEVQVRYITHILETYEQNEMSIDEIAGLTKEFVNTWNIGKVYADGGGGGLQTVNDLQSRHGIQLENYKRLKGVGSKQSRIWQLNSQLQQGSLVVHEDCETIIDQFRSVPWNDTRTDHHEKFPDHSLDALLYSASHDVSQIVRTITVPPKPGSPEWINMQHKRDILRMQRGY